MTYARFRRDAESLVRTFAAADAPPSERQAAGAALVASGRAGDVEDLLRRRAIAHHDAGTERDSTDIRDDLDDALGAAADRAAAAGRAAAALEAAIARGDGIGVYRAVHRLARHDPDRDRAARLVEETRAAAEAGRLDAPRGAVWATVLACFGDRFRDVLVAWLRSPADIDRHCAACALVSAGPWAAPLVLAALDDRSGFVRDGVMYHFGGARAYAALVTDGLATRISAGDPAVARRAATAAGLLGDAGAALVPVLREHAATSGIGVSLSCRHALLRITGAVDEETLHIVRLGLGAGDFEATQAVVTLGARAAPLLDVLAETMGDQIPAIRADFCDAIGQMGAAHPLDDLTAVLLPVLAGEWTARDAENAAEDPNDVRHGYVAPPADRTDVAAAARALAELGAASARARIERMRDAIPAGSPHREERELRWMLTTAAEIVGAEDAVRCS